MLRCTYEHWLYLPLQLGHSIAQKFNLFRQTALRGILVCDVNLISAVKENIQQSIYENGKRASIEVPSPDAAVP